MLYACARFVLGKDTRACGSRAWDEQEIFNPLIVCNMKQEHRFDVVLRREDILSSCQFVPGDVVTFGFRAEDHIEVFIVRVPGDFIGEKLMEKGE